MKPIIIRVDKDDNVTMKLSEFQKYMDEAYQQGKADGEGPYWWRYTGPTYGTGTPVINPTEITCASTEGSTIDAKIVKNNLGAATTTATVYNPDTASTKTI